MLEVVAAILERDGRILICQRTARQSHALKWEFPGGKVEPGETPAQALARELEEELGIRGARGEEIMRYAYTYPGKPAVLLIFLRVTHFEGEPRNLIFEDMRWEAPKRLAEFDLLEGDRDFVRALAGGSVYWS
ncbi:MAG TPA: (deoxy)nucleoside triphosphate pyrophosphohydrolase [Rhizomicrobium sp.]|nr:(deoxy)nucleoside triphosphate pyrophosphohydrolase [Rhizomicrobium sp.]